MRYLLCALAFSVSVAYADLPVNTVNNGATINAGNYYNTAGHETLFTNTAGTGITLNAGSNIRGAEVFNNIYTGNGGNIHIQAPDQVVRLNGNIDVRGGYHQFQVNPGNGGNVTVDAAYLFQNGNIYASGFNGGNVVLNVGGMTQAGLIDASSRLGNDILSGNGGNVTINSTGVADIRGFITTNGASNPIGSNTETPISNNITIIGHGVNMGGTLWAGRQGGTITITSTGNDADVTIPATIPQVSQGGIAQADGGVIRTTSGRDINQGGALLNNNIPGTLGSSGGATTLTAANAIHNTGGIQANGAVNGGRVDSTHPLYIGGTGGNIFLTANSISNSGGIRVNGGTSYETDSNGVSILGGIGGAGGNVTFSSIPTGTGLVSALGGGVPFSVQKGLLGTITAPDPALSTNTLIGILKKSP